MKTTKLYTLTAVEAYIQQRDDFEHRSMSARHCDYSMPTLFGDATCVYEVRSYTTVIYRRLIINDVFYHWLDDNYFSKTTRHHQTLIARATGVSRGTKKQPLVLEPAD